MNPKTGAIGFGNPWNRTLNTQRLPWTEAKYADCIDQEDTNSDAPNVHHTRTPHRMIINRKITCQTSSGLCYRRDHLIQNWGTGLLAKTKCLWQDCTSQTCFMCTDTRSISFSSQQNMRQAARRQRPIHIHTPSTPLLVVFIWQMACAQTHPNSLLPPQRHATWNHASQLAWMAKYSMVTLGVINIPAWP